MGMVAETAILEMGMEEVRAATAMAGLRETVELTETVAVEPVPVGRVEVAITEATATVAPKGIVAAATAMPATGTPAKAAPVPVAQTGGRVAGEAILPLAVPRLAILPLAAPLPASLPMATLPGRAAREAVRVPVVVR
jgi:hypothetical protein